MGAEEAMSLATCVSWADLRDLTAASDQRDRCRCMEDARMSIMMELRVSIGVVVR
jgi:hypothetical protein